MFNDPKRAAVTSVELPRESTCVDVAGTGFTVLDRIYADGALTEEALGGSCGNVLISLAMLRRQVAPVLALGDDATGERLVSEFIQAGAVVRYISRRPGDASPVLAQELDTASGRHDFSFVCPTTRRVLPRYRTIDHSELEPALSLLRDCSVFYADRVSESILEAMRTARDGGAIVYFEPSDCEGGDLFEEALELASVLKYSEDRLGDRLTNRAFEAVHIATFGAEGLRVRDAGHAYWCDAVSAANVIDTCGSGDIVSVAVIDWILKRRLSPRAFSAADLLVGILSGQVLAAENCGFAGARGLFRAKGAAYVRQVLDRRYSAAIP
ncbi:PfkB family carbohydrate kinase [Brevundimonas sp. R86498]|uniref:PfkB family carbohydrate kinase n=1 Tax=Brevundimonas sp. R86498 TaxID=3093845 RepID=UPI0037C587DE